MLLVGISVFRGDDAEIFLIISPSKDERLPTENMLTKTVF
jgi:hypothetical protein